MDTSRFKIKLENLSLGLRKPQRSESFLFLSAIVDLEEFEIVLIVV